MSYAEANLHNSFLELIQDGLPCQLSRLPVGQVLQVIERYFGDELAHQRCEQRHGGIVPHGHHHLIEQHNHRLLLREAADAVLAIPRHAETGTEKLYPDEKEVFS